MLRRQRVRFLRELEAATILQRAFRGKLAIFQFPEFDLLQDELEKAVIEAEINGLMFQVGDEIQTELERQVELELMYLEDIRSRRAAEYAEWLRQQELERLRQLELERLARLAAEAEELRRLLEEQNRQQELVLMRKEDDAVRARMDGESALVELAKMRLEDLESRRMNKFWEDERRRLAEEERLRRLREEEERRRLAGLRMKAAHLAAEQYVTDVVQTAVNNLVEASRRESMERRLMALEDAASLARRGEDERLRMERLRRQQRENELNAAALLRAIPRLAVDLETEVVEDELRAMLQIQVDERNNAVLRRCAHDMAVEFTAAVVRTAILNLTETDEERAQRLRAEAEADELRRMRLEDLASARERRRLKDLQDELARMLGMEGVEEPIDSIVGEAFSYVDDANFDEAENQLQEELDRLLAQGSAADKALLCSVQLLLGHVKLQLAKFSEAHTLFTASQEVRLKLYSADSIQAAEASEALASCAKKMARYDDAAALYASALEITDQTMRGLIEPVQSDIPTADPLQLHVRLLLEQAEMSIERGRYAEAAGQVGQAHEKVLYMRRFASGEYDDDDQSLEALLTDCEFLYAVIEKIKGHYKQAVEKYRKVHDDRERIFGIKHPKIASILGALAEIELCRCHYTKASEFLDMAEEINNQFFGANHPTTLGFVHTRAKIDCAKGNYRPALEAITDALRRRKTIYPDAHPTIAECFFIAGECTRHLGMPKMAQKYYEEAKVIRSKLFAGTHVSLGESSLGLAANAIARTQYVAAVPLLEEAFAQYQLVATSMEIGDFVDLEVCRTELALGYVLVGRYDEAKTHLKAVGKLMHQLVGPKHVHLAASLYVLALYKQALGLYFDANTLYSHCDDILVGLYGSKHPLVLRVALAACVNFRGPGYYEDAAVRLNLAFSTASEMYDHDSIPVTRAIHQKGVLMRDLGDLAEASRLLPLALKACKEKLGMKSAMFAEVLGDIGEALRLEGKYDPAALALSQALQLRRAQYGEAHCMVGEVLVSQGLLLLDQNRPEEALQLLDTVAVPLLSKCFGEAHPHTMYAKGCVGLALNTLYALRNPQAASSAGGAATPKRMASYTGPGGEHRGSARFGRGGVFDTRGKGLIDAALKLFDEYPQCPFGDSHPWALELGGWSEPKGEGDEVLSDHGSDEGGRRNGGHGSRSFVKGHNDTLEGLLISDSAGPAATT
jgi:hypothetical protein